MGPALLAAIAVMPIFGGMLFAANASMFGIRISERLMRSPVEVYAVVLGVATMFVLVTGRVEYVRSSGVDVRLLVVAAILVPVAALVPYFAELIASSRLADGWTASPFSGRAGEASENVRSTLQVPFRFIQIALVTAICEELLFRGAVLAEVESATNTASAVAASSVLFAFHHISFGPAAVFGKLISGTAWGGLYLLGSTLIVPILAHLLFQMLVMRRLARVEAAL